MGNLALVCAPVLWCAKWARPLVKSCDVLWGARREIETRARFPDLEMHFVCSALENCGRKLVLKIFRKKAQLIPTFMQANASSLLKSYPLIRFACYFPSRDNFVPKIVFALKRNFSPKCSKSKMKFVPSAILWTCVPFMQRKSERNCSRTSETASLRKIFLARENKKDFLKKTLLEIVNALTSSSLIRVQLPGQLRSVWRARASSVPQMR